MIRFIIQLYIFAIIIHVIISYLPEFRHKSWALQLKRAVDYTAGPIRRAMPPDMPFDFSPVIVILLLELFIALF